MWHELLVAFCIDAGAGRYSSIFISRSLALSDRDFHREPLWRRLITTLRLTGFSSMIVGTLLLYLIN
jgi:hypothetical protein